MKEKQIIKIWRGLEYSSIDALLNEISLVDKSITINDLIRIFDKLYIKQKVNNSKEKKAKFFINVTFEKTLVQF